jgi:hypothetical protein
MNLLFVKGPRCRLSDVEYVVQRLKAHLPYTHQHMTFKIIECKPMGAFKHITIHYYHKDNVADGPKLE